MINVLFVCHGNICRSTMAESVFTDLVNRRGFSKKFAISSAATHADELGNPPHYGTREKLRREFTANVSHELKTPLTSISGYAEIIANGLARPEDVPRFAGSIYDEVQRLISLINDIIKLSRLDEEEGLPQRQQ